MTLAAALLAVGFALPGRIESDSLEVSVEVRRCPGLSVGEVMRLIALELEAEVVPPERASPSATRVELECEGRLVRLHVVDPMTSKRLERVLSLAAREADVRSRAVALAVAELVLTSWMELTHGDPPPEAAGFARPSPEARLAAEERVRRETASPGRIGHLLAVAQALGPFDGLGLGWGGGIRVGYVSREEWWGVELDLVVARAEADTELGLVRATSWSGALRPTLRLRSNDAWLEAGAGARLGIARLDGTPSDATLARGGSVAGTWAGPSLHAGAGIAWSHLVVALGVEAGHVLRSVSGSVDGGAAVSVDGQWIAGSVGVGWAP